MDLADHFRVIAANWWRILAVAVVIGVASYAYSSSQPNVYQATTLLSVATTDVNNSASGSGLDEQQIAFRAEFYAAIAHTLPVAASAIEKQGLHMTAQHALSSYSMVTNNVSGFILVKADASTPDDSRKLAEGVGQALTATVAAEQETERNQQRKAINERINAIDNLLTTIDKNKDPTDYQNLQNLRSAAVSAEVVLEGSAPISIQVVAPALAKTAPVSPKPFRWGLLGFLATAVLVAEGTVIARAFSDRFARTNDVAAITDFTGLPVLALVPRGRGPEVVEAFRTLRTNLMFLEGAGRPRTIAVVSPNPGAGKSFVALHLAEAAVAVDAQVVVVDADLRRPVLHARLHVDREPGLSNTLRGADLHDAVHKVDHMPSLRVIPSGSPVSDTVGVLGGRAFRQILESLDTAELVVVDTPPGAVYSDALAVAAQCDATLLVLDAKSTRRRAARQMIDALERTGATLIGVVVNGAQHSRRDTYERA